MGRLGTSSVNVRVTSHSGRHRALNESLRRALLRAQLSEDDVAARLAVDPKTVRRWTEGRVPYLRHRWELAGLLGLDETDLWPQAGTARSRPEEVRAIYPSRDAVPVDVWRNLFGSAKREIGILANSALFLAEDPTILATLGNRVQAGVMVRVCVRHSGDVDGAGLDSGGALVLRVRDADAQDRTLRDTGGMEIRAHGAAISNSIYRADDDLLVGQFAYGIPAEKAPVLHLRRIDGGEMAFAYLDCFERVWAGARPLE